MLCYAKALSTANVASSGVRRVGGLLLFYFVVTHVVACSYWSMASHINNKPDCDELLGWGACEALVDGGRVAEQYVHAMHWTLLVMAVNDSGAVDAGQEAFSSLVMVVGIFVNSIVIGGRLRLPNPSTPTRAQPSSRVLDVACCSRASFRFVRDAAARPQPGHDPQAAAARQHHRQLAAQPGAGGAGQEYAHAASPQCAVHAFRHGATMASC
jgi:hypothetical protein